MDESKFEKLSFFKLSLDEINIETTLLKEYLKETSISLNQKRKELISRIEQSKTNRKESGYTNFLEDEAWKFDEPFKKYSYNSQLLSYYSFFESWLKKLCNLHHRLGFNNITVEDLKGQNYIEKSKMYFTKVAGIYLDELNDDWERIKQIQQIRNLIAHNDSNVIKKSEKPITEQPQFQILLKEKYINLDKSNGSFYIENEQFLINVLNLFESYLTIITLKLDKPKVIVKSSELPYDMGRWGIEKVESLIKSTIGGIKLLEDFERDTEEFKNSVSITNSKYIFKSMNWDLTKLLSLFSGGTWETKDSHIVNTKGKIGLKELKKKYKIRDFEDLDIDLSNI